MEQESPFAPLLRRWERHGPLLDVDRQAVLSLPYRRQAFERDAYIVRESEPKGHCSLLLAGLAFSQKVVGNGSRQIISFHVPGDFVDLQDVLLSAADHSVQSLGQSEVAIIQKSALRQVIAASPPIDHAMWLDTLVDAAVLREWVVNVGRRDARSRIAHLLCELTLRLRAAGQACGEQTAFPLTQEQIADATGMTTVHTNRILQGLRQEGLIELRSMRLKVLDWQRLADIGDFSATYLLQGTAADNHHSLAGSRVGAEQGTLGKPFAQQVESADKRPET